jgi:hypothetical protein
MREGLSHIAAAVWNSTVGPAIGCLIVGPDLVTAQCQKCHIEWFLGRPLNARTIAVRPLWWACRQGCNVDFVWGDDGTLDSLLPEKLIVPPQPPRGPRYAAWWNPRLGQAVNVTIHDYAARLLRCTHLGCGAWWKPEWHREGSRVSMSGWWNCPKGCNAAVQERDSLLAQYLDAAPPWEPPAHLVKAAVRARNAPAPRKPGRKPGRKSREEQLRTDPARRALVEEARGRVAAGRWNLHAAAQHLGCVDEGTAQRWINALGVVEAEGHNRH